MSIMTIDRRVRPRARQLAAATSVLTLAFLGVYAGVVRAQDGPGVAWWYVGVLLVAALLALAAAVSGRTRLPMMVCAVLLCLGALIGLLTVGGLLLPAVATAVASARYTERRPATA
jgi:hypothetical protein